MGITDTLQEKLLRKLQIAFNAEIAILCRLNDSRSQFSFLLARADADGAEIEHLSTPRGLKAYCDNVIRSGETLNIEAMSDPGMGSSPLMKAEHFEAYLGEPLVVGGLLIGVLEVIRKNRHKWTKAEIAELRAYARQMRILIDADTADTPPASQSRPI